MSIAHPIPSGTQASPSPAGTHSSPRFVTDMLEITASTGWTPQSELRVWMCWIWRSPGNCGGGWTSSSVSTTSQNKAYYEAQDYFESRSHTDGSRHAPHSRHTGLPFRPDAGGDAPSSVQDAMTALVRCCSRLWFSKATAERSGMDSPTGLTLVH